MDDRTKRVTDSLNKSAKEWGKLVNGMSHLLCTKVATLRLKEVWLQKFISSLLEEQEIMREGGSITTPTDHSSDEIEQMANLSQQLMPIMGLLKKVDDYIHEIHSNSEQLISARKLITSCIEAYPFAESQQRSLIHVESGMDYKFRASPVIMESLLNYLFERGLNSISQKGVGNINIWLSAENNQIALHYRVTGLGLMQVEQNHIFDRFIFMDNSNNVRFGLGFFRLALWHQGHDILCESVSNESTHFTIFFAGSEEEK